MRTLFRLLIFGCCLLASPVLAQPEPFTKGQAAVVLVPRNALKYETFAISTRMGIYTVEIGQGGAGLEIAGRADWARSDWPYMYDVYYEKMKKKKEYVEYEFRGQYAYVKLRYMANIKDLKTALAQTIWPGSVEAFKESPDFTVIADHMLPRIFVGSLAKLPRKSQISLLSSVDWREGAISFETFKGINYVVIDLDRTSFVFNTLQLNQASRVARVINERVLLWLKHSAQLISNTPTLGGIKITINILSKDFLRDRYSDGKPEKLEIYAPYDLVEKFYNLDITSQQLMDGSIVLLDGNRIQVVMAQAG